MLAFLLAVVIFCFIIGIIGFVIHGLFWLFIIAVLLFLLTLAFGGRRASQGRRR